MTSILQSSSVMRLLPQAVRRFAREHGAEYLHGILREVDQLPPKRSMPIISNV